MKTLAAIWVVVGFPALAAVGQSAYEAPTTLSAREILRAQVWRGAAHEVRDAVPTGRGVNHFTLATRYGSFAADGNALLLMRVQEVYALAELEEVSSTREFGEAMKRAGAGQLKVVGNTLKDPVGTVAGVPKGVANLFKGLGKTVSESTQGRQRTAYEDNALKELAGVSKIKRQLAVKLGVNPYSSNPLLQKKLDEVATAMAAGGGAVSLAMMATPAAVSTGLSVASLGQNTRSALAESKPDELYRINLEKLSAMGVEPTVAKAFLNTETLSPWHQSLIVQALGAMPGVAGKTGFLRGVMETTETEADALFAVTTTLLISQVHLREHALTRIAEIDGYPVGVARDGTVVLALCWDYAQWTPAAERLARHLQEFGEKTFEQPKVLVAISGVASPKVHEELAARQIELADRLAPGPLK